MDKGVWWDLRKRMDWKEYEGKSNPIIPYTTVQYLHAILKTFTASEESPAVLARGKPMNPTGEANEGGGEKNFHALLRQGGGQLRLLT
jgi:hypothetical protein